MGVLTRPGPASTLSILLPLTMYLNPTGSIIMLAGFYYGAMYGGSTTSILVNIPGEAASVVTCFDGFQMTKQGRAGEALWIAAVGSFIAGTLGAIAISVIGPGLANMPSSLALRNTSGFIFFSLTTLVSLSGASLTRGLGVGLLGILLSTVGIDPLTGATRFNFGSTGMMRGLDLVPIVVGLFGISEIIISAEEGVGQIYEGKIGKMMPRGKELRKGLMASLRGTALGFPLGMLPGMVVALTTFMAYDLEKGSRSIPRSLEQA